MLSVRDGLDGYVRRMGACEDAEELEKRSEMITHQIRMYFLQKGHKYLRRNIDNFFG